MFWFSVDSYSMYDQRIYCEIDGEMYMETAQDVAAWYRHNTARLRDNPTYGMVLQAPNLQQNLKLFR